MAEFMDDLAAPRRERGRGGTKGDYVDPTTELRLLREGDRDRELIKRYRFHAEGIDYLTSLIADDPRIKPKHGLKGNPVSARLQVKLATD